MTEPPIQPVEEGNHYEHRRGSIYTIDYLNEDIALMFDGRNYRLENRQYFEECIRSGMYELKDELEINQSEERIHLVRLKE